MNKPAPATQMIQTGTRKVQTAFCPLGDRNCTRMAKIGLCTTPECPIVAKERRMAAKAGRPKSLIDLHSDWVDFDMPFSESELEAATSPLYVECLSQSGMPIPHRPKKTPSSFEMPRSESELETATSPLYVECLSQSNMPIPQRLKRTPKSDA